MMVENEVRIQKMKDRIRYPSELMKLSFSILKNLLTINDIITSTMRRPKKNIINKILNMLLPINKPSNTPKIIKISIFIAFREAKLMWKLQF
jgi:hypothetical protein